MFDSDVDVLVVVVGSDVVVFMKVVPFEGVVVVVGVVVDEYSMVK